MGCKLKKKTKTETKKGQNVTFFRLKGGYQGGGGNGRRSHFLGDFFVATQKPFVCLKEVPKQTLCSLLTSDMLDIASNSVLKTSCQLSVADTIKW